ncbi:UDP-N-acetylmuramoyl-tripeptide--D-alanyl-D-alanine ligase [Taibaiella lutea]|uniref:UDP-N-acetylmuramoyl-tripeptide--D-alanyl-D-alanine ligase n=1 Tax=Taibaiella lutea TaxID=2608001 RepID=A0A5M6CE01_9BACT|nr:UDP-N-acetylmuramoyl-tripeptide--D-alanyl-D-alanine ligase [Taibaiella lutea]KAA5533394.1 UDP-N-acetylmuramoyl-tripeptide--D-alanyl-D-alanine ligase [Taibaiella lutea]
MFIPELYNLFLQFPSIQTDSRKIKKGDIFFALKGDNFNGNAFAAKALEDGAAYAVIDESQYATDDRYILTNDVLTTLQLLSHHHRLQLDIPVIAITGSNGKTTTKELLIAVLSAKYKTYATEGNLNNHIGVPLTLLKIKQDAEIAIIEMGANHIGEIASYCKYANPDFGLINNVGKAHLEGFGSLEGVKKAKGELYDYIRKFDGTIFRNADLDYLEKMSQGIQKQITYGTSNAQVIGRAIGDDTMLKVVILTSGMEVQINTQLVGAYNLPNVLAAVAVGHYFNVDIDTIKKALENYTPSNSRSQLIEKGSNKIILDAYNANPTSMKLALENMASLQAENKWLLLGAMKEMGEESVAEHQSLVDLAIQLGFQNVILTGKEFEATKHNYIWFATSSEVKDYLSENKVEHATILIKGSRGSKMEVALEAF